MTTAQELRFALTFEDYDAAVHVFRDVFGLSTLRDLEAQSGRRADPVGAERNARVVRPSPL